MFKINDKIIVELDQFVDAKSLLDLKSYLEYGIAKHIDKLVPAQYTGDIFLDQGTGFVDITKEKKQELIEQYPYLAELDFKQMLMWLRYNMDITYGQSHLHIISARTWDKKHDPTECDRSEVTETFEPFLNWLDSQKIFSSYGRINIFLNEPNSDTPIHHDPPHRHISPKDQFIWIKLSDRKRFFVYDENTKEKHYVNGTVSTFDNHNYHGSEPSKYASWSIRVDGVFSNEFLIKTGMFEHFKQ